MEATDRVNSATEGERVKERDSEGERGRERERVRVRDGARESDLDREKRNWKKEIQREEIQSYI